MKKSNVPAPLDFNKQLISSIAMEVGKELVHHIRWMYPDVYEKMNAGCNLSVRNHVHNDIVSAVNCRTVDEYNAWIDRREKNRRAINKIRNSKP